VRIPVALFLSALLLVTAVSAALAKTPQRSKTWTWAFDADTLGRPPANTGVFGGTWEVVVDSSSVPDTAAAARRILRQSETDDGIDFHYVQFTKPVVDDLAASVRFRIESGEIDPTAGILFQLDKKGKSGYLVRVSGQRKAVIAHYLLYGKRRDLKIASIDPPEPGTWHTLAIERKGSVLVVSYDGKECFQVRDERYSRGSVGLWTEDDTVADFANLQVSTR
jgi:hypothetical protein